MAAALRALRWALLLAAAGAVAPPLQVGRTPTASPLVGGSLDCDMVINGTAPNSTVCVINSTVKAASLSLDFPGDVIFVSGCQLLVSHGLSVRAGGNLSFRGNSTAKVAGDVNLSGTLILADENSSLLSVTGNISLVSHNVTITGNASLSGKLTASLNIATDSLTFSDKSIVNAGDVNIASKEVSMVDAAALTAGNVSIRTSFGQQQQQLAAGVSSSVVLTASITAMSVNVLVDGNVHLCGTLQGWSDRLEKIDVSIRTLRNVTMGDQGGQWNTHQFIVFADYIYLSNQTVHTGGRGCENNQSTKLDQCRQYLNYRPVDPNGTFALDPAVKDTNVSFDLQLVARASLTLQSAHLSASSMLVCSGATLDVDQTILDAQGRGCGPGEGFGRGKEGGEDCRAGGGGSHMGRGGSGANYTTTAVTSCAEAGPTDQPYDLAGDWLPTRAASGGGCGLESPCSNPHTELAAPATAGGLIWLSGQDVALTKTQVDAVGNRGEVNTTDVSGGGAGGHILLWAYGALTVDTANPSTLRADGGQIACSHKQVSGGGGGGFIGIFYTGEPFDPSGLSLSYKGGGMEDQCAVIAPQAGISVTYGHGGLASSVSPCPAGRAGPFCTTCAVGYFANGTAKCQECSNKPEENSVYTTEGWPNSTCPYKCDAGIPDYRTNPQCLPAPFYVWHFFGGLGGALVILICLLLVSGYFLCRRRSSVKWHHRRRQRLEQGDSFLGAGSRVCRFCKSLRERLYWCCNFRDFPNEGEQIFTKEQLPYHVCRVYLHGENDAQFPWGLSSQLPAVVEPLVPAEQWERLAAELGAAAEVRNVEMLYSAFMGVVAPPFSASLACRFRQRRARLLQRCVRRYSEGANCSVFWKPIRARVNPAGELAMIFGCDYGATLGYLDFFDFTRSQLDWAPVDLRQDARLLVAHGKGSFADPFTLDLGDPLVSHLTQSDFGSVAVCTVISTFNRISRSIRSDELACGLHSPKVAHLRRKVEQCAAQCGLAGFVQVFTCQEHSAASPAPARPTAASSIMRNTLDTSFLDLVPPRGGGAPGSLPAPSETPASSQGGRFPAGTRSPLLASPPGSTQLTAPQAAGPQGTSAWAGATASARSSEVSGQLSARVTEAGSQVSGLPPRSVEVKLCLAFIDPSALSASYSAVSPPASAHGPSEAVLTSPMSRASLGEHLDLHGAGASLGAIAESVSFSRLPSARGQWWPFSAWQDRAATTPMTVLVLLLTLGFVDLLHFIIIGAMIFQISYIVFGIWILVPPFTQPLAIVIGPIFMLTEMPRLGRLYALLSICGMVNAVVATIALLAVQLVDSWFFNFAELLTVCIVKAAIYFLTIVHIRNLEAAWDLSFVDAPQGDFLGQILAAESSGRQVLSMPSYDQANHLLEQGTSFDRPDFGRNSLERTSGKSEFESLSKLLLPPQQGAPFHGGGGAGSSGSGGGDGPGGAAVAGPTSFGSGDSVLHGGSRCSEETSPGKATSRLTGGVDTFRHSSRGSSSSAAEPSPF